MELQMYITLITSMPLETKHTELYVHYIHHVDTSKQKLYDFFLLINKFIPASTLELAYQNIKLQS